MQRHLAREQQGSYRARMGRKLAACAVAVGLGLGSLCLQPSLAQAQAADDEARAAARALANQGADAFDAGDYQKAADLFHRAYKLMPVPSLSVREGQALVKLGRLVEAMEAFQRTARAKIDESSPAVFQRAAQQANDEIAKLKPRIPSLMIVVSGQGKDDPNLEVKMDGAPVQRVLIGVERPVNPGEHKLDASTLWGARASGSVTLAEGQQQVIELKLTGGDPSAAQAGEPPGGVAAGQPGEPTATADVGAPGRAQRTWGYVGLGVGAAGLGVGVVTGLMAVSRHAAAEEACPDMRCVEGSQGDEDADAFRSLRTVSTIGYVVGVLGVGAGVTLLLTAPSEPEGNSAAQVTAYVGPGSVGVVGRF